MKRKLEVLAAAVAVSVVFGALASAAASPTVATGRATNITQHSAVLHGTVNPNGSSTTYFFQWGLTKGYGATGRALSAGDGTHAVAVQETASGLIPGTTYHYRLVATNRFGSSAGADRTFKTAGHPPPGASTGPATQIGTHSATLTGEVNPNGQTTSWTFEYGPCTTYPSCASSSYGSFTAGGTVAAGSRPVTVASSLQGLAAGTIFHYQLIARHGSTVVSYGGDQVFMTHPLTRPVPGVRARTRPGRARHAPFVFTTSGRILPAGIPPQFGCYGNVTIRFFLRLRQVKFTMAGVQADCTFSGRSVFNRRPGGGGRPVRLRVVIRFIRNAYLSTNRAPIEHVKLG